MPDGNDVQTRVVLQQVADASAQEAVKRFVELNPNFAQPKAEIPASLKLAGGVTAAVLTTGVVALVVWLVSSVSAMQVTLARVDERMMNKDGAAETRFAAVEARVTKLEAAPAKPGHAD